MASKSAYDGFALGNNNEQNILYLGASDEGVHIYDIANRQKPVLLKKFLPIQGGDSDGYIYIHI